MICFEDININVSSGGHYVSKPVPYARYIARYTQEFRVQSTVYSTVPYASIDR